MAVSLNAKDEVPLRRSQGVSEGYFKRYVSTLKLGDEFWVYLIIIMSCEVYAVHMFSMSVMTTCLKGRI